MFVIIAMIAPDAIAPGGDGPVPGLEVVEHREYYALDATRLDELRRQLAERQPDASVGRTSRQMETRYTLDLKPEGCRLRDLRVRLEITIHLPRWQPPGRRPTQLGRRWDAMLAALTQHEEGHRDNAIWAARTLHERLTALGAAPDCRTLERAAQREQFKVEMRYMQRDQSYDLRTGHGVRQGSVL